MLGLASLQEAANRRAVTAAHATAGDSVNWQGGGAALPVKCSASVAFDIATIDLPRLRVLFRQFSEVAFAEAPGADRTWFRHVLQECGVPRASEPAARGSTALPQSSSPNGLADADSVRQRWERCGLSRSAGTTGPRRGRQRAFRRRTLRGYCRADSLRGFPDLQADPVETIAVANNAVIVERCAGMGSPAPRYGSPEASLTSTRRSRVLGECAHRVRVSYSGDMTSRNLGDLPCEGVRTLNYPIDLRVEARSE